MSAEASNIMRKNKRNLRGSISCRFFFVAACVLAGSVRADDTMVVGYPENSSLTDGVMRLELRPRYEIVQQDGKEVAKAATMRAMAGYTTPQADGFGGTFELIGVGAFDSGAYNVPVRPLPNGSNPARATILDPKAFNANQLYLSYDGISNTRILAGRQLIELDDLRFVGNVGFRQNMQTYDGLSVVNRSLPDFKVMGAYIFGAKDVLNDEVHMKTVLAEADWTRSRMAHIDTFAYWYGNQENANGSVATGNPAIIPGAALCGAGISGANSLVNPQACNNLTVGARLHGVLMPVGPVGVDYVVEYAHQRAWDGGYAGMGSSFEHLAGTVHWKNAYLSGDYMLMGANGNGSYGFQTPMATKHGFNGWAEMFLTTPKEGLRSQYATLGDKILGFDVSVRYYRFATDFQRTDLGQEWDWSASHPLALNTSFIVQVAKFSVNAAGAASNVDLQSGKPTGLENTTAIWSMLTATF